MKLDIYRLNKKYQEAKTKLLKPLLFILSRWGIKGNHISIARLVLGIIFLSLFFYDKKIAGAIIIIIFILDGFDGSLARYMGQSSDRGKFLDVVTDTTIYSFILISCLNLVNLEYHIAFNILITPLVSLLAIIKKQEFKKSDWIIKPYAECSYFKIFVIVPYFLFIYVGIEWLSYGLILSNIAATLMFIYFYVYIQYRWKKKFNYP